MQEPIHHNSSHFAPISDADLSPAQAQVIKSLARGAVVTAAAEDAGVHRTTIHHWIRTEPAFKIAVETAQSEYAAELNDGIRELAARALLTLHDLLQDISTPPACSARMLPTPAGICPSPSNRRNNSHRPKTCLNPLRRVPNPRSRRPSLVAHPAPAAPAANTKDAVGQMQPECP
jgi:hypothetical protein